MTFNLLFFTIIIKSNKPTVEEVRHRERQNKIRENYAVEFLKNRRMH